MIVRLIPPPAVTSAKVGIVQLIRLIPPPAEASAKVGIVPIDPIGASVDWFCFQFLDSSVPQFLNK
ncbi:MAG: hypothetical protein KDD12_11290, partial [Lewinella sp.]|nr:hypothetical protein [Lewinella sp.]